MILSIDLETRSRIDIKKCGVYKYIEDVEILLLAYCFDEDPIVCVDVLKDGIPEKIIEALYNPGITKCAWNANFERLVLSKILGRPIPVKYWDCAQFRAANLGLSLKLGETAKILGTTAKIDTRLINFFCKPDNKGNFKNPEEHPDKWEEFKVYCAGDVAAEREIRRMIHQMKVVPTDSGVETGLYQLDAEINDRGVRVDMGLVKNAIALDQIKIDQTFDKIKEITEVENPNSVLQLKHYFTKRHQLHIESLNKESVIELIAETSGEARKVLELRQELSKTSTKKYKAVERAVCEDGRVRGMFQAYGATRTGRFAGRLVQLHNLYRNREPLLDEARQMVKAGHDPRVLFDDDILSQLIRTAFLGDPYLTMADFSAIEARVLAWLAGETWMQDVFRGDGKLYEATAAKMFGVPIESVTKESVYRQRGKIAALALGYQGAVGALNAMNADGTDEELQELVDLWRQANPNIVHFWYDIDAAVRRVITTGATEKLRYVTISRDDKWLYIELPSRRKLCYWNPYITDEGIKYEGLYSGKWMTLDSYGGKFTENIVQAIARDCLVLAMHRVDAAGLKIVMHVHDEIVVTGDHLEQLIGIMEQPIAWAPNLILTADGFVSRYYKK